MGDEILDADEPGFPAASVTLLRTMQQHHMQLSQMADQKAGMLMTATALVFSLTVGQAARTGLSLPFLMLGLTAFVTALLALVTVLPSTRLIRGEGANILFFGHFVTMSEDEFRGRMLSLIRDEKAMNETILREVYQLGLVLHRKKYRYLATAYRVFLAGLLGTFVLFVAQTWHLQVPT